MKIIIKIVLKFVKFCIEVLIVYNLLNILANNTVKLKKTVKDKLYCDCGHDF